MSIRVVRPDLTTFIHGIPSGLVPSDVTRAEFERFHEIDVFSHAFLAARSGAAYEVVAKGSPGVEAVVLPVSVEFFSTLQVRPALGRTFIADDEGAAPAAPVAVISHAFWSRALAQDPAVIGKTITLRRLGQELRVSVLGVASPGFAGTDVGAPTDVWLARGASADTQADTPRTFRWWAGGRMLARLRPGASIHDARAQAVQRELEQFDSRLRVSDIRSVLEVTEAALVRERFLAQFGGLVGALALFIACLGLYGTMSYAVTRRTSEIGIRMAVGAEARTVMGMFMRETALVVFVGAIVGLVVAVAVTRVVASLLFGLTPTDPMTIAVAVAVLAAATALAAYMPARRAARMNPTVALRVQ